MIEALANPPYLQQTKTVIEHQRDLLPFKFEYLQTHGNVSLAQFKSPEAIVFFNKRLREAGKNWQITPENIDSTFGSVILDSSIGGAVTTGVKIKGGGGNTFDQTDVSGMQTGVDLEDTRNNQFGTTRITAPSSQQAQAPDVEKILALITNTADRICYVIADKGSASSAEAKGAVNVELTGLASRLVGAGVKGTGGITNDEYQGVLRQELATSIRESAKCKLQVFESLKAMVLTVPVPSRSGAPRQQGLSNPTAKQPDLGTKESETTNNDGKKEKDRIFVRMATDELMALLKDGYSIDLEKVKIYVNQWITISLPFPGVRGPDPIGNISISHFIPSSNYIELEFQRSWIGKFVAMRLDQPVSANCQIKRIVLRAMFLENCEMIDG
jgi:hypothetical protein